MKVFLFVFSSIIIFSSCDKQSEVDVVEPLEERVRAKNYYKMATYRMFNKAKANIKKIEDEGIFGVGH